MKFSILIAAVLFFASPSKQKSSVVHKGTVFGWRPDTIGLVDATRLETFMGNKTRISTTIKGRVVSVTKQKGGWFTVYGGDGKTIAAHFRSYDISIPLALKGKIVTMEGVAQKQFIADDMQSFAGDSVVGKKQHSIKANPKKRLTFEVKGLIVD